MTADRSGRVPLYRQIEGVLRAEIEAGAAGSERLTEASLMERFRVSRYTVRQALAVLSRDGLVARQTKTGTVPAARRVIEQPLEGVYSFARAMTAMGLNPSSEVLSVRTVDASRDVAALLGLGARAQVIELVRLRSADETPLLIETVVLPGRLAEGIERTDLTGSIYELLASLYGIRVTSASESFRPIVLDSTQARLLQVPIGSAAFFVERVARAGERLVELRRSVIRGDRYLYSVNLTS